jgi:hypothetical protein
VRRLPNARAAALFEAMEEFAKMCAGEEFFAGPFSDQQVLRPDESIHDLFRGNIHRLRHGRRAPILAISVASRRSRSAPPNSSGEITISHSQATELMPSAS